MYNLQLKRDGYRMEDGERKLVTFFIETYPNQSFAQLHDLLVKEGSPMPPAEVHKALLRGTPQFLLPTRSDLVVKQLQVTPA